METEAKRRGGFNVYFSKELAARVAMIAEIEKRSFSKMVAILVEDGIGGRVGGAREVPPQTAEQYAAQQLAKVEGGSNV